MSSANVSFTRVQGHLEMVLEIDGTTVAHTSSAESMVLELQIRGVREVQIEGKFSTILPTSEKTLVAASEVQFTEAMPALRLLAACSFMGEFPTIPYPERRKKPRADTYTSTSAA